MKKSIFFVMFFIILFTIVSQAQNVIIKDINVGSDIGPSMFLFRAYQDHQGFIWIGTAYGLLRYDGYEFVKYKEFPQGFPNIDEDRKGLLWILTYNGLYVMDPENKNSTYYDPPHTTQERITFIKVIEDKNGFIWCGTNNGLYKMEPKIREDEQLKNTIFKYGIDSAFHVSFYEFPAIDTSRGYYARALFNIYEDSRGMIWAGGFPGLFVYNAESDEFIRLDDDSNGSSRLDNLEITVIVEENPDIMWLRIDGGAARISNVANAVSGPVVDKTRLNFRSYTPDFMIDVPERIITRTFIMDDQKNFWIGGQYNGLIKMSIDQNGDAIFEKVYPDIGEPIGGLLNRVNSVNKDHTGLIWATHGSQIVRKIREGGIIFTPIDAMLADYHLDNYAFRGCYRDESGNLWICQYGNSVFEITKDGRVSNYTLSDPVNQDNAENSTNSILEINKDLLWIGAGNGVWQLDVRTGKSQKLFPEDINENIFSLDRIENSIIMAKAEGFSVYNMESRRLIHYTEDQSHLQGRNSAIEVMENGEVWLATNLGLCRFNLDRISGEVNFLPLPASADPAIHAIAEEGIIINKIFEDSYGTFWFGTSDGLVRIDTASGERRRLTTTDGLCNISILNIEEDKKGNLWLAGTYGLSVLDPLTFRIKTFDESDGLPRIYHLARSSYRDKEGIIYFGGLGGLYSFDPEQYKKNDVIPPVAITDFSLFNEPVKIDSGRNAILTKNISYTQDIELRYNQNDLSFTFAALDYNNPSQNRYAYKLEGYQDEWIETDASNRIATYTNLKPRKYVFRVEGSNSDGFWNEEGAYLNITIHPPPWKTVWAYVVYGIFILLLLRGYIFWRTQRLRKEKIVLEKKVSERTAELKTANTQLKEHEQELQEVNTLLEEQKEELHEVNTVLEEQKEELMQQKEELQSILENLQKTQEQLVEAEKMAVVGGLVAGVAHEINTPVGIGITAISNLKDEINRMSKLYEKDKINREDFKKFLQSSQDVANLIEKNLERTASLVQSFKQVSTDQVTEQQRIFAFGEYLEDILISLRPKFSDKNIDFIVECNDKLKLNSYPGVFAQIFNNLLLNSLQHGFYEKDKGTITINIEMDKELLKIQYSDNGAGISKKDLPHIFEPFYTSDQHRGTGLGLNIIYNLVKQKLHGTISCESEQGKGVLFRIEVPVK